MIETRKVKKNILFIFLLLGSVVTIYPLAWMVASSFKPEWLIFSNKSLYITHFTFDNYIRGFKGIGGVSFIQYVKNTFILEFFVIIANIVSCSMTGYAFARLRFFGKNVLFVLMLLTMMLPMHATLISKYIMFSKLGWMDTYLPLTVPHFFAVTSFFVFLFVQFMRGIPKELDQVAEVDGCSPVGIYFRIMLPLSLPAIVTTAIFTFIWTYDDFFSQLIYINDPKKFTVALALRQYIDATGWSAFGTLFAMSSVSLVPLLIFFITCQKYLIEGIATTGLKG